MRHEHYEAQRTLKLGVRAWSCMFGELWEARELVVRLFIRNFTARYKQSLLGYAWAVIIPFVAIATFIALDRAGIVTIGPTDVPYPLFALFGLSVFQLFSSGLTASCGALVEAGDMIAKVSFPREVLVLAAIAQAVFEFLVKAVLIVLACVFYSYMPPAAAWFVPLALLPIVFLVLGCGLLLSLVNAVFRDTAQALGMLLTFLMFLTPVLYPAQGDRAALFMFNPLVPFISAPRDLFIYGKMHDPAGFVCACIGSVLVLTVAWRVFHLVETKIPERL